MRADKRIKLGIAGQFRLALDRRIAIPIGFRQIEGVNEFGEFDVLRRPCLDPFNRFSKGIWAHLILPLQLMFSNKNRCFSEEAALIGK